VLVREELKPVVPAARFLRTGIALFRVPAFSGDTAAQMLQRFKALNDQHARHVIVDLRGTAEGSLESGIAAARLFVKSGTLAIKAGREGQGQQKEPIATRAGDGAIDLPVMLLVTTGTSGAAELFAAALDGNKRAELIGERTLGRAGVQKLVKLPEYRGLWLTYARYLGPTGESIHGKGLEPDVQVQEADVEFGAAAPEQDVIFDAALERLRTKKAA
jgi:carboxyl-terminal processing protease